MLDEKGQPIEREIKEKYKAYYKETKQKNSVTLVIDVKKHNKAEYFDAVKSQLMYLTDDIDFIEVNGDQSNKVNFKSDILYEDDYIVIPSSQYYSKPHFVIKNISYGLIDYNELDLTNKFANIGIKVKMEDVAVTPNRESVIYNSKTREAVLKVDKIVNSIVEKKIQESLKESNFLKWIRACNNITFSGRHDNSDVIYRLSQMIDKSQLKPKYNENISFKSDIKGMLSGMLVTQSIANESNYDYKLRKNVNKLKRTDESSSSVLDREVYFAFAAPNTRISSFLATAHPRGITVIRTANEVFYLNEIYDNFVNRKADKATTLTAGITKITSETEDAEKTKALIKEYKKSIEVLDLLVASNLIKDYGKTQVPDSFKVSEEGESQEFDDATKEAARKLLQQQKAKARKENKSFIVGMLGNKYISSYNYKNGFIRKEVKYDDLANDTANIVYGTDDDVLQFNNLGEIFRDTTLQSKINEFTYFDDAESKLVKVAKSNVKYLKQDTKISDFILNIDDSVLKGLPLIKNIFTADFIAEKVLNKCKFLRNFSNFSNESEKEFEKLSNYVERYNINLTNYFTNPSLTCQEFKVLYSAYSAQKKMLLNPDTTEHEKQNIIDAAVNRNGGSDLDLDIIDFDLIDFEMVEMADKYNNLNEVYGSILNHIRELTTISVNKKDQDIPIDLEIEVRNILDQRKDLLEYEFEGINK